MKCDEVCLKNAARLSSVMATRSAGCQVSSVPLGSGQWATLPASLEPLPTQAHAMTVIANVSDLLLWLLRTTW